MTSQPAYDPKGLMKDAFSIDGISAPECRRIFLDWALGLTTAHDTKVQVQLVITQFAGQVPPDHPLMVTLQAALTQAEAPRRRGGRDKRIAQRGNT